MYIGKAKDYIAKSFDAEKALNTPEAAIVERILTTDKASLGLRQALYLHHALVNYPKSS